jgi:4-hydroxy-tetrahydrodipicolinate reductase
MGTTGGDRTKLIETVEKAGNYAVVAPQMGKQVSLRNYYHEDFDTG